MLKNRFVLLIVGIMLTLALSGCLDLFGLPSVSISDDNQWVAFLSMSETAETQTLQAVNQDGTIVVLGNVTDIQGAFDWHPGTSSLVYYNLAAEGTPSVRLVDVNDPAGVTELFGVFAFPGPFWVTQMDYSPDGSRLAMSVILFAEGIDLSRTGLEGDQSLTGNGALYIADVNSGSVLPITTPGEIFPSTFAWSPDSSKITFTAWSDENGDGIIDTSGSDLIDFTGTRVLDLANVYVYDFASQSTISAPGEGLLNFSPTWLDKTSIAYTSFLLDLSGQGGELSSLMALDTASGTTRTLVAGDAQAALSYTSVAAAPDGSKIAYVIVPDQGTLSVSIEGENVEQNDPVPAGPSQIVVANPDGSDARVVYELPAEMQGADVPVWSSDSQSLYITNSNPIFLFTAVNSVETTPEGDDASTQTGLFVQRLIRISVDGSSEPEVLYEGQMGSGGLMQLVIGFAAIEDIDLESPDSPPDTSESVPPPSAQPSS